MQIADELAPLARARGLRVAAVYGGVGIERQAQARPRAHILVATPGRLEDLIAAARSAPRLGPILVLDEADRMLDMGFRPAVDRIVDARPERAPDAVLLGHARRRRRTASHRYTRDAVTVEHRRARDRDRRRRPPLHHASTHDAKLDALVDALARRARARARVRPHQARRGPPRTRLEHARRPRRGAARRHDAAAASARSSASARPRGHAGRDRRRRPRPRHRRHHARDQLRSAGRRPRYIHRVGRTGRAGRTGTSLTLVLDDQREAVSKMAVLAGVDEPRCERTDTPLMVPGLRNQGNSPRAPQAAADGAAASRPSGRVAPRPAAQPGAR